MKIAKYVLPVIAAGFAASSAMAANTASFTNTPVPAGVDIIVGGFGTGSVVGNLNGFIANALVLDTNADWTAAAILLELTSGSIFQEDPDPNFVTNGGILGVPSPGFFGLLPSSEFDSRIFDPHGGASIAGAGGDAGGDVQQFDSVEIDISWNSAGADTADLGVFSIANFTLSGDANGTVQLAITIANVVDRIDFSFVVVNGEIVPEPASLALMGLGGLAVLRRRS